MQAASYDVFVAHMPDQEAATCHARCIHGRSLHEVASAAAALEPPSAAMLCLDCSSLLGWGDALSDAGTSTAPAPEAPEVGESGVSHGKRKHGGDFREGDKRRRQEGLEMRGTTDEELLAAVAEGLQEMQHSGNEEAGGGADRRKAMSEPRSKWESDNESDAEEASAMDVERALGAKAMATTVGASALPSLSSSTPSPAACAMPKKVSGVSRTPTVGMYTPYCVFGCLWWWVFARLFLVVMVSVVQYI
jgi:hypothetical protein